MKHRPPNSFIADLAIEVVTMPVTSRPGNAHGFNFMRGSEDYS